MHCRSGRSKWRKKYCLIQTFCLYLVLERSVHGRSVEEGEVNNKRKGGGGGGEKNGEDKIEEEEEEEEK